MNDFEDGDFEQAMEAAAMAIRIEDQMEEDIRAMRLAVNAGCYLTHPADLAALKISLHLLSAASLNAREALAVCREEVRMQGRLAWTN